MTSYDWPTIRDKAIDSFNGELPGQQLEADIISIFGLYPERVIRAIDDVAEHLAQGKVRAGWGVLRLRLQEASRPAANVTAHGQDREKAVKQAERYIIHAGAHYDRWDTELEDEMFGPRGTLRDYASDLGLNDRLHRLWQQHRPRAIAADEQAEQDAARHREHRATLQAHRDQLRQQGERSSSEAIQRIIDSQEDPF